MRACLRARGQRILVWLDASRRSVAVFSKPVPDAVSSTTQLF